MFLQVQMTLWEERAELWAQSHVSVIQSYVPKWITVATSPPYLFYIIMHTHGHMCTYIEFF